MKRKPSLTVPEFRTLLESMVATASTELDATRARMDALRTETRPPG